jgi:hypothetical protein
MSNKKLEVRNDKPVMKNQLHVIRCFSTTFNLNLYVVNIELKV